jgi:hypothetical protein
MMTRKQFLKSAVGLCAATLGLTVLSSCGTPPPQPDGGNDEPPGGGTGSNPGSGSGSSTPVARCAQNGTNVAIGTNHGHIMVVSKDEVAAAADMTYHIQGTSDHDHTVALTASDYVQLQQDHAIMTTSSFDADHSHTIMVACA